jgi:hypothetical protein
MFPFPHVQRLRLALSKGPNRVCISLFPHPRTQTSSFRNVVFSRYLEIRSMDMSTKLVILNVLHLGEKSLDSTSCLSCLSCSSLQTCPQHLFCSASRAFAAGIARVVANCPSGKAVDEVSLVGADAPEKVAGTLWRDPNASPGNDRWTKCLQMGVERYSVWSTDRLTVILNKPYVIVKK